MNNYLKVSMMNIVRPIYFRIEVYQVKKEKEELCVYIYFRLAKRKRNREY